MGVEGGFCFVWLREELVYALEGVFCFFYVVVEVFFGKRGYVFPYYGVVFASLGTLGYFVAIADDVCEEVVAGKAKGGVAGEGDGVFFWAYC